MMKPIALFRQVVPRSAGVKVFVHRVLLREFAVVCAETLEGPGYPLRRRHHKHARIKVGLAPDRPRGHRVADGTHVGVRRAELSTPRHRPLDFNIKIVVRNPLVRKLPQVKLGLHMFILFGTGPNRPRTLRNPDNCYVLKRGASGSGKPAVASYQPQLVLPPHHSAPRKKVSLTINTPAHKQRRKDDPHGACSSPRRRASLIQAHQRAPIPSLVRL